MKGYFKLADDNNDHKVIDTLNEYFFRPGIMRLVTDIIRKKSVPQTVKTPELLPVVLLLAAIGKSAEKKASELYLPPPPVVQPPPPPSFYNAQQFLKEEQKSNKSRWLIPVVAAGLFLYLLSQQRPISEIREFIGRNRPLLTLVPVLGYFLGKKPEEVNETK